MAIKINASNRILSSSTGFQQQAGPFETVDTTPVQQGLNQTAGALSAVADRMNKEVQAKLKEQKDLEEANKKRDSDFYVADQQFNFAVNSAKILGESFQGDVTDLEGEKTNTVNKLQQALRSSLGGAKDPDTRNKVFQKISPTLASAIGQIYSKERSYKASKFKAKYDKAISDSISLAYNNPMTYQQLIKSSDEFTGALLNIVDPEEAEALRQKSNSSIVSAAVRGLASTDPYEAERFFNSEDVVNSLLPGERNSTLGYIQAQKNAVESDARRQQAERQEAIRGEMLLRIRALESSSNAAKEEYEVNQLIENEVIQPAVGASLLQGIDEKNKVLVEQEKSVGRVQASIESNSPLNFQDPQSQKDVDNYTENALRGVTDPQRRYDIVAGIVGATKMFPTTIKNEITANILSGSPQQMAQSAQAIKRFSEDYNKAYQQFSDDVVKKSILINSRTEAGLSPQEVAKVIQDNNLAKDAPLGSTVYLERAAAADQEKEVFDEGVVNQFFRDDPNSVPKGMVEDWKTFKRDAILSGLSSEEASKFAYERVKGSWTVSNLTGQTWRKNAPETIYGDVNSDDNSDWMSDQLYELVKKSKPFESSKTLSRYFPSIAEGLPEFLKYQTIKNDIELVYTGDKKKGYQMFLRNSGAILPLMDQKTGQPMLFKPDFTKTEEYKKIKKKKAKIDEQIEERQKKNEFAFVNVSPKGSAPKYVELTGRTAAAYKASMREDSNYSEGVYQAQETTRTMENLIGSPSESPLPPREGE